MLRNLFVVGVEADEDGVGRLTSYRLRGSGVIAGGGSATCPFSITRCISTLDTSEEDEPSRISNGSSVGRRSRTRHSPFNHISDREL